MNVQILKEITADWKVDFKMPNHTYLISKERDKTHDKMVGYIKEGTTEVIWLKNAMTFSKSHRKFKELKSYE